MPGTQGALSSHFEVHSDGTKLHFALLKKKKARKGMRHDRPIEKRGGFCELTDTPSARARSYQRDRPKGPLWPLCFITSTNCADAHVKKQGKQKTWYNCTTESQLSTDH